MSINELDQSGEQPTRSTRVAGTVQAHEAGYFTEETSVDVVTRRNKNAESDRLRFAMEVITRKLHEAVKEIEPTQEEWFKAIMFLTETGHLCTDWRQEFILLSDVLGVSMLVDAINNRRPSGASESTVLGPFHVDGSPHLEMGDNICLDGKGTPLYIHGSIRDLEGKPIDNVHLDVWQANDEGFYDVQQKGYQPDFNLRGTFSTGADGKYWFRGVKPKFYPIPDDGTVGSLLKMLGRHPFRPAHLHFILEAEGFSPLTTHLFDPDDPYIHSDAVFGVKQSLLVKFQWVDQPTRLLEMDFAEPFWEVEHDFTLCRVESTTSSGTATKGA